MEGDGVDGNTESGWLGMIEDGRVTSVVADCAFADDDCANVGDGDDTDDDSCLSILSLRLVSCNALRFHSKYRI